MAKTNSLKKNNFLPQSSDLRRVRKVKGNKDAGRTKTYLPHQAQTPLKKECCNLN